jgi:hypothetical protein
VNFQVGEFGSPSTIFYNPCGREYLLANGCMIRRPVLVEEAVCRLERVKMSSRSPELTDARKAEGKPENQQGYVPETGSGRDGVRLRWDKTVVRCLRQVDKSCNSEVQTRIWRCRDAVMGIRCLGRV